jgi:trk system potassium uptake protein TrkA
MNIVILGAGSIGSYLATILSEDEHNVIVIDRDMKALERLARSADVGTRLGSGTDWRVLEDLTELAPDLFIAMSSDDETNLIACAMAKNLGYPKTVARIRQSEFLDGSRLDFGRLFFVDHIVGTELIVAHDIFTRIINTDPLAVENFAHGAVQMRTIVVPSDFSGVGRPLSQVSLASGLLIGLIRRKMGEGKEMVIFPKGQDFLLPGDEATVIGETKVMHHLHEIFGTPKKTTRSVVVVGGSGVAMHLCRFLEQQKIACKIIEQDEEKCRHLAKSFPHATILCHDGSDFALLREERVDLADVFVACTKSHETNILAAAMAKQAGCREALAVVADESFRPLLEGLGIAHTLSERSSIAKRVLAILQGDTVVSIASLYGDRAKIMEVKISSGSKLVGTPISDLRPSLPQDFLIAMIENRSGITIPKGNNILAPGDTAIVICSPDTIDQVRDDF